MASLRETTLVAAAVIVAGGAAFTLFGFERGREGGVSLTAGGAPTVLWAFAVLVAGSMSAYFFAAMMDPGPSEMDRKLRPAFGTACALCGVDALALAGAATGMLPSAPVVSVVIGSFLVVAAMAIVVVWLTRRKRSR